MTPFVSVIIPCRNEEKYIGKVLLNVIEQDYPADKVEVFVVDGSSTDRTREIVSEISASYLNIHILDNTDKVVPHALNLAIRESRGEVIIRMDAHAIYPGNYISTLIKYLYELNADNVGGVWITLPGADTLKAEAIAAATSHLFGIGNAHYRTGAAKFMKVDTVPFGCYRREVFDRIGLFDEDLIRNQDDEFNGRLIKNRGKIYLIPSLEIQYFARDNFSKLASMFYLYGLFKPLVNRKLGFPATFRQLIPPLFVLFIITLLLLFIAVVKVPVVLSSIAVIYVIATFFFAIKLSLKKRQFIAYYLVLIFPLIHFSYGLGYLAGIFRFIVFSRKLRPNKVRINR